MSDKPEGLKVREELKDLGNAFREWKVGYIEGLEEFKRIYDDRVKLALTRSEEAKDVAERIATALNRPGKDDGAPDSKELTYDQKAHSVEFTTWMREGRNEDALKELEQKVLSVGVDPAGGYLVPQAIQYDVDNQLFERSEIMGLVNTETLTTDALTLVLDDQGTDPGAVWVSEAGARAETTTPVLREITIPAHELHAQPRSTQKLLDDSGVDAEAWLASKLADRFGRAIEATLITGTGAGQPRGLTTYTDGTGQDEVEQIVATTTGGTPGAGTFTWHDFAQVIGALETQYLKGSVWLMSRLMMRNTMQLRDANNLPIWQNSIQVGQPPTLLGYPVFFDTTLAAPGTASLSAMFGNFRESYTMVRRTGMRVLRDPYTAKPHVLFDSTMRVGGALVNGRAVKIMVLDS